MCPNIPPGKAQFSKNGNTYTYVMNLGCGISLTNSVTCNPEGTTPETKWPGFGSISASCGSVIFPVSIISPPTMEAPGYATFDWDTSECDEIIEECCKCHCDAPTTCCGPKGEETCCAGECINEKCCDPVSVCGAKCCEAGQQCINGQCCDAANICGGQCCGAGQQCINGQCCDAGNVCGNSCGCPTGQQCIGGECLAPPTTTPEPTTTTANPDCKSVWWPPDTGCGPQECASIDTCCGAECSGYDSPWAAPYDITSEGACNSWLQANPNNPCETTTTPVPCDDWECYDGCVYVGDCKGTLTLQGCENCKENFTCSPVTGECFGDGWSTGSVVSIEECEAGCEGTTTTTSTTKDPCSDCLENQVCLNDGSCCWAHLYCGGICCPAGKDCVGGQCCDPADVCGNSCGCPAGKQCVNGECKDCVICDPGTTPSPDGVCCYPPKTAPFQVLSRGVGYESILRRLNENKVNYVIVGSFAYRAQGLDISYNDIDVMYENNSENTQRLRSALAALTEEFKNFNFGENTRITIDLGEGEKIDLISGLSPYSYRDLDSDSLIAEAFGLPVKVCSPNKLFMLLQRSKKQPGEDTEIKKIQEELNFLRKNVLEARMYPPFITPKGKNSY